MFHPFGIDDPRSQTATATGWVCPKCNLYISGDTPHSCGDYQFSFNDERSIVEKLDRIIKLLEKLNRRV